MPEPKMNFGCATAADGKIYVMGGMTGCKIVCGSEVYDPKEDTWSPMKPIPSLRTDQFVALVGEEFLVHGGHIYRPEFHTLVEQYLRDPGYESDNGPYDMIIWKMQTRRKPDRPNLQRERGAVFVAQGKLHLKPLAVLAVDDELLAIVELPAESREQIVTSLVRSRGLGSDIKEIVWQKAQPSLSFPQLCGPT
ncbi:unnamed protein product [Calypogeia fissa]